MAKNNQTIIITSIIVGVVLIIALALIFTRNSDETTTETAHENNTAENAENDGNSESSEAAMSSPITPLGESWSGILGGLAVSMEYDATTKSIYGTVRNTSSQRLCYVQAEPHLKLGMITVGELGPEKLGHLDPGQEAISNLSVINEQSLSGISYDGYVVHMELFDCSGSGPTTDTEEDTESNEEHGSEGQE